VIAAGLALAAAAPAAAQDEAPDAPSSEQLEDIRKRLEDRERDREMFEAAAEERERELEALRQRVIEAADSLQKGERRASEIEARLAQYRERAARLQTDLDAQMSTLSEVLAALQAMERSKPPAIIVSPDDAADAARAAILLSSAAPEIQERAARLRETLDEIERVAQEMAAEQTALSKAEGELRARRSLLQELLEQKREEFELANRRAAEAQREASQLAAQASSLQGVVQRLERLAEAVAPRLKPPAPELAREPDFTPAAPAVARPAAPAPAVDPGLAGRFSDARGRIAAPVAGAVTARFGESQPGGGRSEGMRFAAREDAVVVAPFPGKVVFARPFRPIGNVLILDVGGGYHIILAGLARFDVVEGQAIEAGEPIGAMARGREGNELYLEIRKDSEPVDPKPWLRPDTVFYEN